MRIGIVGDLHIAPVPEKRIDNYFEVGLNKIEQIAQRCNIVIFLGDIFTNYKVSETYIYQLIQHLYRCSYLYKTTFYTIIGNHDVLSEDENNLNQSSLGLLNVCKAINVITPENPLKISDNTQKYVFNTIPVKFKKAQKYLNETKFIYPDSLSILLAHHEYGNVNDCSFCYEDFKNKGLNMIFLGHDHKPFDRGRIVYPDFTVYRSGSIMRNRAEEYNFNRCLYYFVLENGKVSCEVINYVPAQNVFKIEAITRQNYKKEKFLEAMNSIIDKYKNNSTKNNRFSIKNILEEELKAPPKVISGIEKKYTSIGESFL